MQAGSMLILPPRADHVVADELCHPIHLSHRVTEASDLTSFVLPRPVRVKAAPDDRSEPRM